jgi:hypothetical protein
MGDICFEYRPHTKGMEVVQSFPGNPGGCTAF